MRLYVDGVLVASRADTTAGEAYLGYWRLGGDNLGGWPSSPPTATSSGRSTRSPIYPSALTAAQIQAQYVLGTTGQGGGGNQSPSASFTTSTSGLTASVNGSWLERPRRLDHELRLELRRRSHRFGRDGLAHLRGRRDLHGDAHRDRQRWRDRDDDPPGHGVGSHRPPECSPPTRSAGPWEPVGGARQTSEARGRTRRRRSFSVSGGAGNLSMAAGSGPSAYLNGVSAQDVDLTTALRLRQGRDRHDLHLDGGPPDRHVGLPGEGPQCVDVDESRPRANRSAVPRRCSRRRWCPGSS